MTPKQKRKLLRNAGIREMSVRSILQELSEINVYLLFLDFIERNHQDLYSESELKEKRDTAYTLKFHLKSVLTPLILMQQ